MEFFEAVAKRRSTRKYHATQVPPEVIEKAFDAALIAPNSSNMQPWEFYWVRSPEKKKALVDACFRQPAASTAAELVVAVCRKDTWRRNRRLMIENLKATKAPKPAFDYYEKLMPMVYFQDPLQILGFCKWVVLNTIGLLKPVPRGPCSRAELFQVLSKTTALACQNFMLAITAQGYSTCPMEGYDERRVKKVLGLGWGSRVVMAISVGEGDPDGIFGKQVRHDRDLFIHSI